MLGNAGEVLHVFNSIEWYAMYGPECEGGGEDVTTYEKKLRLLQLLMKFNCTVTSTWTNNDDDRGCHTCGPGVLASARSNLIISWGHVINAQRTK